MQFKHSFMRSSGPHMIEGLIAMCELIPHRGVVAEIGSFFGESTLIFSQYFNAVYAIDPWDFESSEELKQGSAVDNNHPLVMSGPQVERCFDENVAGVDNIIKLKGRDDDLINHFADASIDVAYIDSIHTFDVCAASAVRWYRKCRVALAGHDYSDAFPGVVEAVKGVSAMVGVEPIIFADSSWLILRPDAR